MKRYTKHTVYSHEDKIFPDNVPVKSLIIQPSFLCFSETQMYFVFKCDFHKQIYVYVYTHTHNFFSFFSLSAGTESRALCMLSIYSAAEVHTPSLKNLFSLIFARNFSVHSTIRIVKISIKREKI